MGDNPLCYSKTKDKLFFLENKGKAPTKKLHKKKIEEKKHCVIKKELK